MDKNIRIIEIYGPKASGKTAQIQLICNYLKSLDIEYIVFEKADSTDLRKYLENDSDKIIINEGVLIDEVQEDLKIGKTKEYILEKYKQNLFDYSVLSHKYKILQIILMPENYNPEYYERTIRLANLLELQNSVTEKEVEYSYDTYKHLKLVNKYDFFQNLDFKIVNFDENDTILEIGKLILNEIKKA